VNAEALHAAWVDACVGDDEWLRSLRTFNVGAPAFRDAADGVAVQLQRTTRGGGRS
jgi:hypothetical protein